MTARNTTMRLYWPKAEALDGTWTLPALTRVQERAYTSPIWYTPSKD